MDTGKFRTLEDEALVALAQGGDDGAFDFLLKKYSALVRMVTRAYFLTGGDDKDLLQEGMIGLFKAVRDFSPDKDMAFHSFAQMCIQRQTVSAVRAANRKKHEPLNHSISLDAKGAAQRTAPDPESIIIGRETADAAIEKMDKLLSPLEKKVASLYLEGKSYGDIAKALDRDVKSVDNALMRIKRKLSSRQ